MKSKLSIMLIAICILLVFTTAIAGFNISDIFFGGEYHSFSELNDLVSNDTNEMNLDFNYKYDNDTIDLSEYDSFTLNGNGHMIKGITGNESFSIDEKNVTVNNVTFKDCRHVGFDLVASNITFNNVNFTDCTALNNESTYLTSYESNVTFNNCTFQSKEDCSSEFFESDGCAIFNNCSFSGESSLDYPHIVVDRGELLVANSNFENLTSKFATAINYKGCNLTILNSSFTNLDSDLSAGAVMAKFFPRSEDGDESNINNYSANDFVIDNCNFTKVSSTQDGGAVYVDLDSDCKGVVQKLVLTNSRFTDCSSRFGGAVANLGGVFKIKNTTFENNSASFEGGAICTSWSNVTLDDSILVNNTASSNAGAIYFDKGKLTIKGCELEDNNVFNQSSKSANAIYANDAVLTFRDSKFNNTGLSVYSSFSNSTKMHNVEQNSDVFSLNNNDYITSVENDGVNLNLLNNTNKSNGTLPDKYDLRDHGWVSPVRKQGDNDDCWAFATANSMESSLLKATGQNYNISQNYIQKLQLKYYKVGDARINHTGFAYSGLGNALSWYGAALKNAPYDDRGYVTDVDFSEERIHVQDAMIIFGQRNDTQDLIKRAILDHGAVSTQIEFGSEVNPKYNAHYINTTESQPNHFVSVIGWDDNYPVDNFIEQPPGPGAWIYKDSMGDNSTAYLSYYDGTFLAMDKNPIVGQNAGICYIFENDNDYNINYQTDLTGLTGFDENYTMYSNEFLSKGNDSIAAVGTYFNESGIDYSFDVYVNGNLTHSQNGTSDFAGFRTIVLDKYIPVKTGDKFKVVFKNKNLPYQAYSRQHYMTNMSFASSNGNEWVDFAQFNKTVCLKVYTIDN